MGRTNPTYRDLLRAIEDRWQPYRRTLRRADQPRFDRLLAYARDHADAAGTLNHEDRLAPAFVSIAIEQERRLEELDARFEELDARFEELDAQFKELDARFEELDARFDEPETDRESQDDRDAQEAPPRAHARLDE